MQNSVCVRLCECREIRKEVEIWKHQSIKNNPLFPFSFSISFSYTKTKKKKSFTFLSYLWFFYFLSFTLICYFTHNHTYIYTYIPRAYIHISGPIFTTHKKNCTQNFCNTDIWRKIRKFIVEEMKKKQYTVIIIRENA